MIKILIVDDSTTDSMLLKHIFETQEDMTVVGCAHNSIEALQLIEKLKPDLITMDIEMPHMNGYETTKLIMTKFPTPVVIISSNVTDHEVDATFKALEAGAFSVLRKPSDVQSNDFPRVSSYMIDTVRSMAEIKAIKKMRFTKSKVIPMPISESFQKHYKLIAMGASVGGPQALKKILSELPADFPVPIVIVQHMAHGFIEDFVKWLDGQVALKVKCAVDDEKLKSGVVYFAPDDYHCTIQQRKNGYYISFVKGPLITGFCPSITMLMKSIAIFCNGDVVGVLLTGMGLDGADGMRELKHKGAHTIVQDEESCIVYGMGNVATSFGAVDVEIELNEIGRYLIALTKT